MMAEKHSIGTKSKHNMKINMKINNLLFIKKIKIMYLSLCTLSF